MSSGYTTRTHHTDSLYNWSLVYDHTVIGKEVDRNIFALIQHPELQTNVLAILSSFTQFNHIDGNNYIEYDISHCTQGYIYIQIYNKQNELLKSNQSSLFLTVPSSRSTLREQPFNF